MGDKMRNLIVNDIVKSVDSDHIYRILWISDDKKSIYLFNTNTLDMPSLIQYTELQKQIDEGVFIFQDSDPYLSMVSEEYLSEKEKGFRDNIWRIMSDVVHAEPQIFDKHGRGKIIAETISKTGKTRFAIYQYLKIYWKCGKIKNAFLPGYQNCGGRGKEHTARGNGKIGRVHKYGENIGINIDENTKKIFEQAIKKYYHNRKEHTFKAVYEYMIRDYAKIPSQSNKISGVELIAQNRIPTIRQFRYWYNKNYDVKEKFSSRKGEKNYELNHRAVLGKSDYGIMGPGAKYQTDSTIGDIYLVSRFNRAEIIGRPIIYFLIDVFSRMVTGMYVGLEGASWVGSMMALANAASDKVKYCAEYGIEITEEEWPCRYVPNAILADRGEMESKHVETLINALNVRVENAPPNRADMKGIVERYFRTSNDDAIVFLPGHVKSSEAERGGKDYRLDAKFDIHQFTKILIQCVLYHNNHHFLESYERNGDMISDDVEPIPIKLWNWGIAHYGALRSYPEETVKLCLMPTDTATVTEKGIRFKKLYYLCERAAKERWFEMARAKGSFNVEISYDPRNMSAIYVRNSDGTFDRCFLAQWQDKYINMCLDEINYLHEKEKLAQRKNAPKEMIKKIDLLTEIDNVIAEAEAMARQTAVPKSKTARTGNIRENRRNEKELNRHEEAFRLVHENLSTENIETHEKDDLKNNPILAMIDKDLEERLNGK